MYPEWLIAFLFLLPLVALMAYFLFFVSRSMKEESDQVMLKGRLADAEIVSYRADEWLWVTYRFTPHGATEPITCEKAVGLGVRRFALGSTVPVRYMAKYPSISLLVPYATQQLSSS